MEVLPHPPPPQTLSRSLPAAAASSLFAPLLASAFAPLTKSHGSHEGNEGNEGTKKTFHRVGSGSVRGFHCVDGCVLL